MAPVKVAPSSVCLLDYSKTIIPTGGQATLHCTHRGKPYDEVVQVITAENCYAPLLGLADSTRLGILNYDIDAVNQLQSFSTASLPPLGELKFESIKWGWMNWGSPLTNSGSHHQAHPSCSAPLYCSKATHYQRCPKQTHPHGSTGPRECSHRMDIKHGSTRMTSVILMLHTDFVEQQRFN